MLNILNIDDISSNIFFNKSVKNNILNNGYFTKINYSDELIIMTGLFIKLCLKEIQYENFFNKYKCNFSLKENNELIQKIKLLEMNIIQKFNINISKIPQYILYDQFKNGSIKIHNIKNTNDFLLRISGIWENDTHYGLTYKIISL
jgi:hypothetical protein